MKLGLGFASHLSNVPDMLAMSELDARWCALERFETGLDTKKSAGASIASAVARAKWKGTRMESAIPLLDRWERARDDWKRTGASPDRAGLSADLQAAEGAAKDAAGYTPPASREGGDLVAGDELVGAQSRSAFASSTFDKLQGRWRLLMEWMTGETEPSSPVQRALWRLRALSKANPPSLLKRWLEFEARWTDGIVAYPIDSEWVTKGKAPDDEVFTGGYQLDLGTAEKHASEKGYKTKGLEPADKLVPHPEDMPGPAAARAALELAERAKRELADLPGGLADELIPEWMRPYLRVGAFAAGAGAALSALEKVDTLGGIFRAFRR